MKVYFDTLGCQKNYNDSDIAMGLLENRGYEIAQTPEDADAIIVNTCGFIEDAKRESISEIFEMAEYRKAGKKLLAAGCLVQRYSKELFDDIPEIDGFIGVNDLEKLPDFLDEIFAKDERKTEVCDYDPMDYIRVAESRRIPDNPYTTYLRISEGCDNACAYCVIPKIRGPYRSRSMESIVSEAKKLAVAGCKELVLIAQDTGCYGKDIYGKTVLADLLKELCKIEGIIWIRLMYCYENNITDELVQVMATETKICHYIDIPLQHASNPVLLNMKRGTSVEQIRIKLDKLRKAMPDIHIRTTMMVGFPGESEEDYENLIDFVEEQKFDRLGAFAFSCEEGTAAAEMKEQISEDVKQERLDNLMLTQLQISLEHNKELIGHTITVMVDEKDEDGVSYIGRTVYDAPEIDNSVIFTPLAEHKPGDIVNVEILEAFDYDLEGREV